MSDNAVSPVKPCTKCGTVMPFSNFCKGHDRHGLAHHCRQCSSTTMREWRARNRQRDLENGRRYAENNREKRRAANKRWRESNLEYNAQRSQKWRSDNPERARELNAASKRRSRSTPEGILAYRVRNRVANALRANESGGGGQTFRILGYTPMELRKHIERQFLPGMGWHNAGEWHLDHIIPLSSFKIERKDDPEMRRAWALTNLRPLWAIENIRKGARRETLL